MQRGSSSGHVLPPRICSVLHGGQKAADLSIYLLHFYDPLQGLPVFIWAASNALWCNMSAHSPPWNSWTSVTSVFSLVPGHQTRAHLETSTGQPSSPSPQCCCCSAKCYVGDLWTCTLYAHYHRWDPPLWCCWWTGKNNKVFSIKISSMSRNV